MELWEAAAGVIIGASSAFGAWKGAKSKDKAIEHQLKPANGEGTLANQVHRLDGKLEAVLLGQASLQESIMETHHLARAAAEDSGKTHVEFLRLFDNLPCKTIQPPMCGSKVKG